MERVGCSGRVSDFVDVPGDYLFVEKPAEEAYLQVYFEPDHSSPIIETGTQHSIVRRLGAREDDELWPNGRFAETVDYEFDVQSTCERAAAEAIKSDILVWDRILVLRWTPEVRAKDIEAGLECFKHGEPIDWQEWSYDD